MNTNLGRPCIGTLFITGQKLGGEETRINDKRYEQKIEIKNLRLQQIKYTSSRERNIVLR